MRNWGGRFGWSSDCNRGVVCARVVGGFGIIGAAAGSLFVFKGVYRAVLINYPCRDEKDGLIMNGR